MPWNEVKLALNRHMQRTVITLSSRMLPVFLLPTCAKALVRDLKGSHCAGGGGADLLSWSSSVCQSHTCSNVNKTDPNKVFSNNRVAFIILDGDHIVVARSILEA